MKVLSERFNQRVNLLIMEIVYRASAQFSIVCLEYCTAQTPLRVYPQ
jgi:hypothetical protein